MWDVREYKMLIANIQIYDDQNYEKIWQVKSSNAELALAKAIDFVHKKDGEQGNAIRRLAIFLREDFEALGKALAQDFTRIKNEKK